MAGLRFVGLGDPRFTPDKDTRDEVAPPSVSQAGLAIAGLARRSAEEGEPVDIAVVHDGAAATEIDGTAALILSGHYHRREQNLLPGGSLSFFQGSTGASGLRGLEKEKPTPVRASVLYIDRDSGAPAGLGRHHAGRAGAGAGEDRAQDLRRAVPGGGDERVVLRRRSPSGSPSGGPSGSPSLRVRRGRRRPSLALAGGVPYAFGVPDG